jgi:hypothetical protein
MSSRNLINDNHFFFNTKKKVIDKTSQSEIEVESSYEGLRLNFPIKKKDFHDLVNYLKKDTVRRKKKA